MSLCPNFQANFEGGEKEPTGGQPVAILYTCPTNPWQWVYRGEQRRFFAPRKPILVV
jgi:hypothetical protein